MKNLRYIFLAIILFPFIETTTICMSSSSVEFELKQRKLDDYLRDNKGKQLVMIIGGGHRYYKYPENFYLVDSERSPSIKVYPDLKMDINADSKNQELLNKFDVIVFEYVATDVLNLKAFQNVLNFLKPEGVFLFDSPINFSIHEIPKDFSETEGVVHTTSNGKIWTFFQEQKFDVYVSNKENEGLVEEAKKLITEHLTKLLTEVGFSNVQVIKNINQSEYEKYVVSTNKEHLPEFVISAKKIH